MGIKEKLLDRLAPLRARCTRAMGLIKEVPRALFQKWLCHLNKRWVPYAVLVLIAFLAGYLVAPSSPEEETRAEATEEPDTTTWTCSMHPQIRLPKPGKCPICFMDLVPVKSSSEDDGHPRKIQMSEGAKRLAEITTSPVERKFVTTTVRMVGKVDYDETKLGHITAWIPGRLDRLYVDYTGVPVKKGDHMVYIYSPDLLVAQEELLQALKAEKELGASTLEVMRETARATVESAREKLHLFGLTKEQVAGIEKLGKTSDHLTIYSPMSGIVISKHAVEGMYVSTGMRIYTIADLSQVWVRLEAYESDMSFLKHGQEVEFTTEAYPGWAFTGKIAFIDPFLNEKTRTLSLRVNVPNADGRLKPGMFVRAAVKAKVGAKGEVVAPSLAGKWMCPMHPEVVKDELGKCDICEMPLVTAESLGYVEGKEASSAPLVIPATAPLITGKRAVVYVEVPQTEKPTYEGKAVVLGLRAGDYYVVKSGLDEGERVVTNGAFKIDSALQILAKPSMMSPEDHAPGKEAATAATPEEPTRPVEKSIPAEFRSQIGELLRSYIGVQKALAADDADKASSEVETVRKAIEAIDMGLLEYSDHEIWMKELGGLKKSLDQIAMASDIQGQRSGFALLSESLIRVVRHFGFQSEGKLYLINCPMAFDGRGGNWLQDVEEISNPYFGAAMLRCGEVKETFQPSEKP